MLLLYLTLALAVMTTMGLLALTEVAGKQTPTASASNISECENGKPRKWAGHAASYDRTHGNFATWWQNDIDAAADIWDDNHEADFAFVHSSSSDNDWYKQTRIWDDRPGLAMTEINSQEACFLVEVDVLFNTRFTFLQCRNDCDESDDEWDAKHVAVHEFSHFFVLKDTHWPWHIPCISYSKHSTDYTLCGHEKRHVQEIYGED